VVAHGDFTLDNVIVAEGTFAGMVDVGRLGVADHHFFQLSTSCSNRHHPRWRRRASREH
jgi:aminoglycoside phosphotransferase